MVAQCVGAIAGAAFLRAIISQKHRGGDVLGTTGLNANIAIWQVYCTNYLLCQHVKLGYPHNLLHRRDSDNHDDQRIISNADFHIPNEK